MCVLEQFGNLRVPFLKECPGICEVLYTVFHTGFLVCMGGGRGEG